MASTTYVPSTFSITDFLKNGWDFFKENFMTLLVFAVVWALASAIPSSLVNMILGKNNGLLHFILSLALQVWSAYLMLGSTRYLLALIRGGKPELSVLFDNMKDFQTYLITYIHYIIVVGLGFVCFIIPGVYLALKYSFVMMLAADNKASGSEAFKMSAQMTEGNKLNIFLYGLVSMVIVLGGMLLLVVPGLIAAAVSGIGFYLMYEYSLKRIGKTK